MRRTPAGIHSIGLRTINLTACLDWMLSAGLVHTGAACFASQHAVIIQPPGHFIHVTPALMFPTPIAFAHARASI